MRIELGTEKDSLIFFVTYSIIKVIAIVVAIERCIQVRSKGITLCMYINAMGDSKIKSENKFKFLSPFFRIIITSKTEIRNRTKASPYLSIPNNQFDVEDI